MRIYEDLRYAIEEKYEIWSKINRLNLMKLSWFNIWEVKRFDKITMKGTLFMYELIKISNLLVKERGILKRMLDCKT